MKKYLLIVIIIVLIGLLMASCGGGSDTSASENPALGTDNSSSGIDGKSLVESRCTECHSLDKAVSFHGNSDGWKRIVEEMMKKGADLNDTEKDAVINYLAETYP